MKQRIRWYLELFRIMARMGFKVHRSLGGWTVLLFYAGYFTSFASDLVMLWLMMRAFPSLGGFGMWEVFVFFELDLICYAGAGVFMGKFWDMYNYINQGTLDCALLRPVRPLIYTTLQNMQFGFFSYIAFGLGVVALALTKLAVPGSLVKWLTILALGLTGSLIYFSIMALSSMLTFWIGKADVLSGLFRGSLRDVMRYPLSIYPQAIRMIFTVVIPYAFISYYPALVILGRTAHAGGWLAAVAGVAALMLELVWVVWRAGLRRYEGAGG